MDDMIHRECEDFGLDTGIRNFRMGGGEILSFNPSDPFLIARINSAMRQLEAKQENYKEKVQRITQSALTDEIFDFMEQTDNDMRQIINGIFRQELSAAAFDGVGLYAYNTSGVPIWIAFFDGVMSRMDVTVKKAQSEEAQKVEKLLAKYKRK